MMQWFFFFLFSALGSFCSTSRLTARQNLARLSGLGPSAAPWLTALIRRMCVSNGLVGDLLVALRCFAPRQCFGSDSNVF